MERVCFDHGSGTPVEPTVFETMRPWFSEKFGGTGAVHAGGVEAREAIDEAREKVARFVNAASPEEIIFTSSGTEAINLAIKGCALADRKRGNGLVFSAIDHPAVTQSIDFLESQGFKGTRIGVGKEGVVLPAEVTSSATDKVILVCAHAANHDLGTIQDLPGISEAADKLGAAFF